jgi:Na+/melibiose symporter-like transporter
MAALGLPLVVHLPPFFTNTVGLSVGVVGAIFLAVRLIDIGLYPLVGAFVDRTQTRLGRYRPWMIAATPVIAAASLLVFMARPGAGAAFVTASLLALYVGFSMAVIAQTSWAATLSSDYDQRTRVYGWWQAGNVVGMLLVLAIPPLLALAGRGEAALGVAGMGLFIAVMMPLTVALAVWRVPEPRAARPVKPRLMDYLGLFRRRSVRRLMLADLLFGLAPGFIGALFVYFFEQARGFASAQANVLILIYFVSGLAGAVIWSKVAAQIGKHRALALAGLCFAAAVILVATTPSRNFGFGLVAMVLAGVPFSAGPLLLRAMMADVGDEERLETGKDRTGMLYALLTATTKVGYALAVGIAYPVLELVGFQGGDGAVNTAGAIRALEVLFAAVPALVLLAGAWVIRGYPIDQTRQREIREALAARGEAS